MRNRIGSVPHPPDSPGSPCLPPGLVHLRMDFQGGERVITELIQAFNVLPNLFSFLLCQGTGPTEPLQKTLREGLPGAPGGPDHGDIRMNSDLS